jgi:3-dehydroquinate synthase
MQKITITTDKKISGIYIGEKLQNLQKYLPAGKAVIITDEKILNLYGRLFPPFPVITIGSGEKHKTMKTLDGIFEKLVEYEADRSTFIVGIGGGIVCDVCGFAASIFMRGLRFGFVSTTLLSQVDASVGGKNGVNFSGYKNMIGVFNQPEFVICDTSMLSTLDDREFRGGFSEIIKAAAIRKEDLFSYLEENAEKALNKDADVIEKIIYESVMVKAAVVEKDEKEKGERKILNFGHTFAHAIEHMTGMSHGEAVSVGMVLATGLSEKLDLLDKNDARRIYSLIRKFGLPESARVDFSGILDAMKKDKKREGDSLHMILLDRIGHALIRKISFELLEKHIYDLR